MRLRTLTIAITLIFLASGLLAAPALAKDPSVSTLRQRLHHARTMSRRAHERVSTATAALAAARQLYAATSASISTPAPGTAPDPAATTAAAPSTPATTDQTLAATSPAGGVAPADEVAALQARFKAVKRVAHRWDVKVTRLRKQLRQLKQIAEWDRRSQWKPLIAIASRQYHVSAAGLHRMMMLESGGRRAVGGTYKGLFQYHPGTWAGSWNPWRQESIFNGWAQIRATAYALSRGMGPSQWPNTYPMAF